MFILLQNNFRPSDYVTGDIKIKDKVFSKLYGSYLNFIEFDGKRYWDIRENVPVKVNSKFIRLEFELGKTNTQLLLIQRR